MVVLVAHNELQHEAVESEGTDGKVVRTCPLYPGLTCRDHLNAAVDIDTARGEDLVQVPFVELCPNTWLVLPTDEVIRVVEKDQFQPAAIRKQATLLQKKLGTPLPAETYAKVKPILDVAETASEDMAWKKTLSILATLEPIVPEPHASFLKLVAGRLETVEEMVRFDAEELIENASPTDAEKTQAKTIFETVDVEVYGKHLPVRDALKAWLQQHGS